MILGIDVSHHQPPARVNYHAIRSAGYQFVFARAAYGVKPDSTFTAHITRAREAGLDVGAYSFFRQTQPATEQLEVFRAQMAAAGLGEGDLAPVLDLEWNDQYDGVTVPAKFVPAYTMLSALRREYGGAIAYLAPGFFQTLGKPSALLDFPWWIAHYTEGDPWCPWRSWDIHQFTGKGEVQGFAGPLDLNRAQSLPRIGTQLSPDITPGLRPEDMRDEDFE